MTILGTSGTAVAFSIDPFAELDDVFLHFHAKLEALSHSPRSVAEARITSEELRALIQWFSDLRKKPRMWCEDPWQQRIEGSLIASNQEMFGALLVILASELCRDKASEEELWPAVTAVLAADKLTFRLLFDANRQPLALCKTAMAAGARKLKLRNLIDCSGRQEYVDTLRLQFGFTERGAHKRLPEWLAGLGCPVPVRILCGEEEEYEHLASASFTKMWRTLEGFRKRKIDLEFAAATLQASPWIRHAWIDEILKNTEASRNRVFPSGLAYSPSVTSDVAQEPVCNVTLQWEVAAKPRLRLHLNDDRVCEILGSAGRAQFAVDGAIVGTWTSSDHGEWRGDRQLPCEPRNAPPNLRPTLLTISGDNHLLEEIDLSELGVNEALTIFDLRTGRPVSTVSHLDPERDYAFVCDTDLNLPGAAREARTKHRCAFAITGPWTSTIRVLCDGVTYWKPLIGEEDSTPLINVEMVLPPGCYAEPGSAIGIQLNGIPVDARSVALTVGRAEYAVVRKSGVWETEQAVRITPEMALKNERIRVRIGGYPRVVVPKLAIKVRGIACMESGTGDEDDLRWVFLNRERPLNRAGGSGSAKLFVDEPGWLYEGHHRVGKIGTRPFPMRDLHGWGSQLIVRIDSDKDFVMVRSIEDHGAGRFQAPMFRGRTEAVFHWRAPTSLGRDHRVLLWENLLSEPRVLRSNQIESKKDGLVWKLADSRSVVAMAICHQGERNASFWTVEGIIHALKVAPSLGLFGLLRWLHLPVLGEHFYPYVLDAVRKAPAEFVSGWLRDVSLPYDLVHRVGEPGLQMVVRALLWNHVEKSETRIDRIADAFEDANGLDTRKSEPEMFKNKLLRMGYVCPSLAYSFAAQKVRGDKYKRYARSVAASMLGLAEAVDAEFLRNYLASTRREVGERIGKTPEFLRAGEAAFAAYLDNPAMNYSEFEPSLRRLGETSLGPQFLTASLLMRLADRR